MVKLKLQECAELVGFSCKSQHCKVWRKLTFVTCLCCALDKLLKGSLATTGILNLKNFNAE